MVARTLAVLLPLSLVSACGGSTAADDGRLQVVASLYPLQWATAEVAGDLAEVTSLTPPGAEPHDLELGPQDVAAVGEADLVVYLNGFQPAVDEAVGQEAGDSAYDVAAAARLDLTYTPVDEPDERGIRDPHFWLDPTRLADVTDAVAEQLSRVDQPNADEYAARGAEVRASLEALDQEMASGLASCSGRDLVTSHNAFGYLADRYDFNQVGITGITPEEDPSPQDLADIAAFVERNRVRTIYSETLVSPEVAETVARETGAATAVLDPIEGLTDQSRGADYLAVMRSNLTTLQDGQPCR